MSHLEQSAPDVIISDIAMPTQDGIDLVRQVRALNGATSKVPMVALTAFTSDDDRRRILGAGFNTYFAKPVAPLELMRVLANLRAEGASPSTIM
jgi:CheY-like chemotaxis protein